MKLIELRVVDKEFENTEFWVLNFGFCLLNFGFWILTIKSI